MALAVAGFVFAVTRLLEIDEEVEIRHWRVETRQGPRTFQTRLDDWPRMLPHGGLLIRDLAGDLSTLVVGLDISGSFRKSGQFDDALHYAALYIYGHLNALGC